MSLHSKDLILSQTKHLAAFIIRAFKDERFVVARGWAKLPFSAMSHCNLGRVSHPLAPPNRINLPN
jgi:hypothetical protein